MPTYEYQCKKCKSIEEFTHSIKDNSKYKCPKCKKVMVRLISLNRTGFIMKGGTPAINYREKQLRLKRREKLAVKEKARFGSGPQIQPNVAGMETDSWSDAQKVAKEAGMDTESYTPYIEKEKKNKIKVA
jgi:putative FmdB family regulatory protein